MLTVFVILNREAVKNLRPFLLRAGEDTRPYVRNGAYVFVGKAFSGNSRIAPAGNSFRV